MKSKTTNATGWEIQWYNDKDGWIMMYSGFSNPHKAFTFMKTIQMDQTRLRVYETLT